ncbi:MAG TPA: DinB family protein [Tepidisphaeraceae bacterium]|nr:DinB family protein [Tepidisphaeraceae bacterium]
MDLLDRLLGHDAWTTRQLLLRCRELSDAQLDQEFDIAHCTARATLIHIISNMEIWTDLMSGRPQRTDNDRDVEGLLRRLDKVAADLSSFARSIAHDGRWDDLWLDHLDHPPRKKSYGGAIAHVITHSMHHRAQLLYILRRLGVRDLIEGDVLSWESEVKNAMP